jgi:hypothetical protein
MDTYNQRTIDGKLMYYHFRDGHWKPVDKTPAKIAAAKKSSEKAAKLAAAALMAAAGGPVVAEVNATAPTSTGAPHTDKLSAAKLAKLVFEQLNIAMKAGLDEI